MPLLGPGDPLPRRPSRVLVAGTSGSGKTTLAARIAAALGLPHVEIDALFHGPGWTRRPSFEADVRRFGAGPRWVTEWQYGAVRAHLADRADLLVWLDLPRALVLRQVVRRTLARRLRRRQLWNGNVEPPLRTVLTDRDHIVRWAWRTHPRTGERVAEVRRRRPDLVVVRLRSRKDVARWSRGPLLRSALDDWLPGWCREHLGGEPVEVLFRSEQVSTVAGVRLAGGREVVVKARADDGRARACVEAQAVLAGRGFPCARPLTPVVGVAELAVHAEEHRPGGEILRGSSPDVAVRCAAVFARLMGELAGVTVAPPLPNPPWVRWDHTDPGEWPAIELLDGRDQGAVPRHVVEAAGRARRRLLAAGLPCVLGHADFEAQNLRWEGGQVRSVHDWDSLAWQPEAALVGAASGSFASDGPPTLAPVASSAAFLAAYQDRRGRAFSAAELEVAWAAGVWMAAYNAREMALCGGSPAGGEALRDQAAERLRRAGA